MKDEDVMNEISALCIRYAEMYMAERAVKNCEDMSNYEILVKGFNINKELFLEQYNKVETLVKSQIK